MAHLLFQDSISPFNQRLGFKPVTAAIVPGGECFGSFQPATPKLSHGIVQIAKATHTQLGNSLRLKELHLA